MPDLPNFDDLFRIGRDEVLTRNAKISRDSVEREGMDANIMIAAGAAMGDEVVGQVASLAAAIFQDSAVGPDLDRLLFDRYGLIRRQASPSFGSVEFSTTVVSPTTFSIPTGTIVQTDSGLQFITVETGTFLVGTVGPVVVAVRSVLAGASTNAGIGLITSIISRITGSPTDLVVTNSLATAGADDAEKDPSFRDRGRRFFVTARRGTLDALEVAGLGVTGVSRASAFEVLDAYGRSNKYVQLIVTDGYTEAFADYSTVPPRYQVQSQFLTAQVSLAIQNYRAFGIFVQPYVAKVILQAVQLALAFTAGADVNTVALKARAAVVNYINDLKPGTTMSIATIQSRLQLIAGLSYTGREVMSPAGDVLPKPLQVIRTSLGIVSAVSSQNNTPIITGINPDAVTLAP
jgi:hypothetical protein